MEYYYDINLHFEDTYINYYKWNSYEHFNRLPIFKVNDIHTFLEYDIKLNCEYKNIIISDGITSLGLEIIDNKVVYISSIPYEDEFKINKLALVLPESLVYEIGNRKNLKIVLTIDKVKTRLLSLINENNKDLIKYLYYEVTGELSNNYKKMTNYLESDINTNFSNQYYELYDMIIVGD